jgi:hypothetical protein
LDVGVIGVGAIGNQHGATVFPSVEVLLNHIDAVSICVPTQFHDGVTQQVFAAKKDVFIEKPICATAAVAKAFEAFKLKSYGNSKNPVIVDGRNIINPDEFIRAGFIYWGIGRRDKNNHLLSEAGA